MKIKITYDNQDNINEEIDMEMADIDTFLSLLKKCDFVFAANGDTQMFSCISYDAHQHYFDIHLEDKID